MGNIQKENIILKKIQEAGLPIGASYLSQQLDLAPATIGRVLTTLEARGLITKVSNKGRVLTDRGSDFLTQEAIKEEKKRTASKLVDFATESDKNILLEILQVRKLLEVYTVEHACLNASNEEIMELERLMLEHIREIRNGGLGSETDFEIHLAIARASKMQTIYQILKIILTKDNAYAKFSYVSDHLKNTQIKQHDSIIQAIKEHDPEKAKIAMNTHLTQIMNDINQYYQEPEK